MRGHEAKATTLATLFVLCLDWSGFSRSHCFGVFNQHGKPRLDKLAVEDYDFWHRETLEAQTSEPRWPLC